MSQSASQGGVSYSEPRLDGSLNKETTMATTEPQDYRQVPGLFRLWDLQFVLNRNDDFQVHYAEQTEAGLPLFAVYRRRSSAGMGGGE